MDTSLEQIKEQQKQSWNKFAPGWKKWDEMTMEFLQPIGNEIIRLLDLRATDSVLDIATGTGEPAISISKIVTNGKVIGTDLSEEMLAIAEQKANHQNLLNISFQEADVSAMPFNEENFNAVSCRFGFMFFPDMPIAAKEIFRVLKSGGRLATSVWNIAEKNFWVTAMMDAIKRNIEVTPLPPGAPSMFRCAEPGLMEDILKQAGFKNVQVEEVLTKLKCLTAEGYWNFMTDMSAPVTMALSSADEKTAKKIKDEVFSAIKQKFGNEVVAIEASSLVLYGEK